MSKKPDLYEITAALAEAMKLVVKQYHALTELERLGSDTKQLNKAWQKYSDALVKATECQMVLNKAMKEYKEKTTRTK